MKHLTILLGTLMLTLSSVAMAQEDDMYFTSRKEKKETAPKAEKTTHKVEIVYETEEPVMHRFPVSWLHPNCVMWTSTTDVADAIPPHRPTLCMLMPRRPTPVRRRPTNFRHRASTI